MDRFLKSKSFTFLLYIFLGTLILFMVQQIQPFLAGTFGFLKSVLGPFLIAMIISYVLNPVVNLLNRRKVPRTVAVLLIYSLFITTLIVIFMNVAPVFMKQLRELNSLMPELKMKVQHFFNSIYDNESLPEAVRNGLFHSLNHSQQSVTFMISGMVKEIGTTVNMLFVAFIVPFLAFYMLKDFQLIEKTALAFVPKTYRSSVVRLCLNIDQALGSYIRGQLMVCLLVGMLAYIGYFFIGLPYPLLLASLVGLFNIIPYLGPFFGAAPALIVASTVSIKMLLLAAVVNVIVQILEGNVVGPQIVGRTLHLHPLMIIFALLVGGELAGVVGLILAVPVMAALKVILQHFVSYYVQRNRTQ